MSTISRAVDAFFPGDRGYRSAPASIARPWHESDSDQGRSLAGARVLLAWVAVVSLYRAHGRPRGLRRKRILDGRGDRAQPAQ